MAARCFIDMLLEDTIWNMFVGEVLVCEQEPQICRSHGIYMEHLYITIIVANIVATNQG